MMETLALFAPAVTTLFGDPPNARHGGVDGQAIGLLEKAAGSTRRAVYRGMFITFYHGAFCRAVYFVIFTPGV
jgi:hypothetical protein